MNKKRYLNRTFIIFTFICMFSVINFVQTVDAGSDEIVSNYIDGLIEFEGENKAANDWGEDKYKEWHNLLSSEEEEELKKYTDENYIKLNKYLRSTKGNLSNELLKESENKSINMIDRALKKTKTGTPIMVYRRVTGIELGVQFEDGSLYDVQEGNKINREKFSFLSKKLKGMIKTEYGYLSTSLSNIFGPEHSKRPIIIKIELPEGTNAAYLGSLSKWPEENEMLVARGFIYKVEGISIVVDKGKEYIQLNAKGILK
ncbi:ADP-ribosyltransferase [Bacillus cereus group sp. MYBK59-1]|uniref:ADP-ribosyltransferase n=1 Tax=Bacillus cereus group TaxID=86661 RepID=UPI002A45367F|nr:ADP-ribosyltransferase [Bacillus cereus]MDA2135445.1 ADP-ribosyltransferase [Bacillus cereus]